MRKFLYISLMLLFSFMAAWAQKEYIYQDTSLLQDEEPLQNDDTASDANDEQNDTMITDTVLYKNKLQLSPDSIVSWKKLKQYSYMNRLDSLLREKNKKVKIQPAEKEFKPGFFAKLLNSPVLKVLLWMLAIAFVLFIIYKLFLTEGLFKVKTKAIDETKTNEPEQIINAETNFDELVKNALLHKDYRQAVRLHYLRTLHLLAGKNLIEMSPGKTNYQYVSEIKSRAYQNDFAALTLNYEYVWYGEFNIENDSYSKIESGFINFNKKI